MKNTFSKVKAFLDRYVFIGFIINAFLLTIIIEALNRKSLLKGMKFMGGSPLTFLINVSIISLTLCISLLFMRFRLFAQAVINVIWLVLGTVNFVILGYRMTPFSAEDLNLIPMAFRIAKNYLTLGSVIAMVTAVIILVGTVVVLFKKLPKDQTKRNIFSMAVRTALMAFGTFTILNMGMKTSALSENFQNLAEAYEDYGFAYCFSNSLVDVGISKPEDYTQERMEQIAQSLQNGSGNKGFSFSKEENAGKINGTLASLENNAVTEENPNIIMIQLESFFDPTFIIGTEYSEDPIPFFRELKENYTSGLLDVPVVGAGTANTEFEILTGMTTDYFGAGEYPYNTVLSGTTTESLPNVLKSSGYSSTVIHNNTGSFYKRNIVFSNMGFDVFDPEEYMYNMSDTYTNWHKDDVLTGEIMDSLARTEGQDFVYTITVQSHGRYPQEQVLENPKIQVTRNDSSVNTNALEYYVNQVSDVDNMIRALVAELEAKGEPTVLVMYGDHLPAFGFTKEELTQPSLYNTEYVIWNNFGLQMENKERSTETLGTDLLSAIGLRGGIIERFHQVYDGNSEYDDVLRLLEYDMLYGSGYIYAAMGEGEIVEKEDLRPYAATELAYGNRTVSVSDVKIIDDELYVYGENFNISSRIIVNDSVKSTEYIDEHTLKLDSVPSKMETVCVGQCDGNSNVLGSTTNVINVSGMDAA